MADLVGMSIEPDKFAIEVMRQGKPVSFSPHDMEWWRKDTEAILMQFTGLHDKNGKEIWEGDLVQTKMDGKNVTCEIIFQEGYFALKLTSPDPTDYRKYIGIMYGANPYGEVIGNIYENPELLK